MGEKNEMITCITTNCGQEFELTAGWQRLMEENPDIQKPKRCFVCRQKAKREKEER